MKRRRQIVWACFRRWLHCINPFNILRGHRSWTVYGPDGRIVVVAVDRGDQVPSIMYYQDLKYYKSL